MKTEHTYLATVVEPGKCQGCGGRMLFPRGRWAHKRCAAAIDYGRRLREAEAGVSVHVSVPSKDALEKMMAGLDAAVDGAYRIKWRAL